MKSFTRLGFALVPLAALLGASVAQAQYYDDGYEGPPPPRGYRGEGRRMAGPPRGPIGLNCEATMPGLTGPHPYSCPLLEPRPLGSRCHCDTPPAAFTSPRTLVGEVVP